MPEDLGEELARLSVQLHLHPLALDAHLLSSGSATKHHALCVLNKRSFNVKNVR